MVIHIFATQKNMCNNYSFDELNEMLNKAERAIMEDYEEERTLKRRAADDTAGNSKRNRRD